MLTVRLALAVTTVPSGLVALAVMVVVPEVSAVAIPVAELMVATEGIVDFHTAGWIVLGPRVTD